MEGGLGVLDGQEISEYRSFFFSAFERVTYSLFRE